MLPIWKKSLDLVDCQGYVHGVVEPCVPSFNPGHFMVRSVFAEFRSKSPFVRSDTEFYDSFNRPIGEFKYMCTMGLYFVL